MRWAGTVGIDASQNRTRLTAMSRDGNATAADSKVMHFATRNLGIFARDELMPALENARVHHVMGQPREDVRALFEREGLAGIQSASRAHVESLFPQLPESVRAAYARPTVAELAASDAAATGVRVAGQAGSRDAAGRWTQSHAEIEVMLG